MIQVESVLDVADNSGAKKVKCIKGGIQSWVEEQENSKKS